MPVLSGPDFWRLSPRVLTETSRKLVHPSQPDLAKECAVQLKVSSLHAFDRKPACHEDDGKPCLHKSGSGSSGRCPSAHEV